MPRKSRAKPPSPLKYFNFSPEVIRLVVMMYARSPLSLRNVEELLSRHLVDRQTYKTRRSAAPAEWQDIIG